ncbi:hypothetical protein [Bacteroides sp.]
MKRTTYILIGILISLLVLLVAGVFYLSMQKPDSDLYTLTLPDKMAQAELNGVRAVKLYAGDSPKVWLEGACVNIVPSTDGKNKVAYPESAHLKVTQEADTLVICLDLSNYNLPKQKRNYIVPALQANSLQLTIEADANLAYLSNVIPGMHTKISGVQLDSLNTYTQGEGLRLDSCNIRSLRVDGNRASFVANKSTISHLYLDLDVLNNWHVDACDIDTEYLTGSGKHRNNLQKGECRRMLWTPKTEGAELNVTLVEKGCVIIPSE